MKLFNFKEAISRIIFWGQNIRYLSKKQYLATIFLLLFIVVIVFTSVFINQRKEIERKENILRSFYENEGSGDPPDEERPARIREETYIMVHICGEILNPGVYDMEKGSRIADLIETAGGETETACIDSLNLAQEVFDGQKIYVPSREEVVSGEFQETGSPDVDNSVDGGHSLIVNINTASSGKLQSLPGIGPVIAEKIITYREKHGSFGRKGDLMNVSGIGPKKFKRIEHLIDV